MKTSFFSITALLILVISTLPPAFAASNGKTIATQGNDKGATACFACHGTNGMGNKQAGYPYLAALPVNYLKRQLENFKSGLRQNAIMMPIAKKLSPADIAAVANYYSTLKNDLLTTANLTGNTSNPQAMMLFEKGQWSKGIPACVQCHGPNGTGVATQFPPIIGQPYSYIRNQLTAWQDGKRKGDPVNLMHSVANKLNLGEIDSLAHYLAMQ